MERDRIFSVRFYPSALDMYSKTQALLHSSSCSPAAPQAAAAAALKPSCHSLQVKCNRAAARLSLVQVPRTWPPCVSLSLGLLPGLSCSCMETTNQNDRCSARFPAVPRLHRHHTHQRRVLAAHLLRSVFSACSHCLDWNWIDQVSWRPRSNLDTRCSFRSWPAVFVGSFLPGILEWLNPDRRAGIDADHPSSRRHVNAR